MASENDKVPHWESLIASKMRPCATICEVEDPVRRNNLEKTRRWHKEHPEYGAEYYAEHREKMRKASDEWKKAHPEYVREAARRYREKHKNDPEYRAKKQAYDRGYRERKRLLKQQGPMECSQEEQA
jgi:hypothetical protein